MPTWIRRAKRIMHEKHLTQTDIAPSMGKTTRGAIGHYFTGRSQPSIDQLEGLAKFLGVSLSWLVSENGDNAAVDDETLEQCLCLVEAAQKLNPEIDLSPAQVAKITAYLYQMNKDGQKINEKKTLDLVKLFTV